MWTHPTMIVAAALAIAAEAPTDDSARAALGQLQGTWVLISAERDGREVGEDEAGKTTLVIRGNTFAFPGDAEVGTSPSGTFTIDPSKAPKSIDSTSATGEIWLGIYEIEGDRYRVCFAPPGKDRPTEFASKPGSGHLLQAWRRAKP